MLEQLGGRAKHFKSPGNFKSIVVMTLGLA